MTKEELLSYLKHAKNEAGCFDLGDFACDDIDEIIKLIEKQERELKIKNEYLRLIYDKGFDYDGYNKVESLKGLIDELVDYANKAYANDDISVIYTGGCNKQYNILHEEIPQVIQNEITTDDKDLKPILEVLSLAKPQIDKNEEITAILDLEDLKSLDYLYKLYKNKN